MKRDTKSVVIATFLTLASLCLPAAWGQTSGPIDKFDPAGDWTGTWKCNEVGSGTVNSPSEFYNGSFETHPTITIVRSPNGYTTIMWIYPEGQPPEFAYSHMGFYFPDEDMKTGWVGFFGGKNTSGGSEAPVLRLRHKNDGSRILEGKSTGVFWDGYGSFMQSCDWKFTSTTPPAY